MGGLGSSHLRPLAGALRVVSHTRCAVVRERLLSSGRVELATGSYLGLAFCRLLALGLDKKTWTVEETAQKKKDSKQKRKEKAAEKAAAILKGAGSAEWRVWAHPQTTVSLFRWCESFGTSQPALNCADITACNCHAGIFIYPSSSRLWLYRRETAVVCTFGFWLASSSSLLTCVRMSQLGIGFRSQYEMAI